MLYMNKTYVIIGNESNATQLHMMVATQEWAMSCMLSKHYRGNTVKVMIAVWQQNVIPICHR